MKQGENVFFFLSKHFIFFFLSLDKKKVSDFELNPAAKNIF